MRSFLPDDPPEPPPLDQDGDHGDMSATSSTAAANAGSGEQASDNALVGSERSSSSNVEPGHAGEEKSRGKNGGGSGRAGSPGNANNRIGGGEGAFVDEAAAGGAGLLLASPRHLEPFLLPSSSSASPLMTTLSTANLMSAAVPNASNIAAGGGVQNGPGTVEAATAAGVFVGSMAEMLPSKYPSGASGGGGAMGADERLWLVYEGVSAAGKGVISKINAPDPYWLGRAPAGAVCPHQHSMEFCSSFESANLLRAVQVGSYKVVNFSFVSASNLRVLCCLYCSLCLRVGCRSVPRLCLGDPVARNGWCFCPAERAGGVRPVPEA